MGSVRSMVALAAIGLVLGACARDLTRDEAVVVFQQRGATPAEAACTADSLVQLDRLDAADPFRVLDESDHEMFVDITTRCASGERSDPNVGDVAVLEGAIAAGLPGGPGISVAGSGEEDSPEPPSPPTSVDPASARAAAIERLLLVGRSLEFAGCVVDQLVALDAQHVLESEDFGVGLSPLEANAYAVCS